MSLIVDLSNSINAVPTSVWVAVGSAIGIAGIVQAVTHYVDGLNEKTLTLLGTALSFVLVAIQYATSAAQSNPLVLGPDTASILGLAVLASRFLVTPAYKLLIDAQTLRKQNASAPANATATSTPAPASNGEFVG